MEKHNITLRTYNHHDSLMLMSEDLKRLNEIFELLISLNIDTSKRVDIDNQRYVVRRLSTGSFELFVTLYLPMATAITGFVFLIIKEIQQAKERELSLKLKEKELAQSEMKINSQFINDAAKILSVNPNDKISKKIIKKAAMRTLEYIGNNPCGVINGQDYSIPETSTLVIKELILEIEELTNNGDE